MKIVTLDFETYYDRNYTLGKYTTSMYVRDPQFKVHMLGVKIDDGPTEICVTDRAIRETLGSIDWSDAAILAHNTMFDGFILTQHYGIIPSYYLDTLSMARALYPHLSSHSLGSLAAYFGKDGKLEGRLLQTKGKRDLNPQETELLAEYCEQDTNLCYEIHQEHMAPGLPPVERDLIDLTIRLFCEPVLEIDVDKADAKFKDEVLIKDRVLAEAVSPGMVATAMVESREVREVAKDTVMSQDKLAVELIALGVAPPRKISPRTGKETWAFAKSDPGFKALLEHPDPKVVALIKARLRVKSTGDETRAKRFVDEGRLGKFPVGLRYYAAHTGRWGGTNKMNLQNLRRGGELRRSLLAPHGHVVVVADSAQIEARTTAWLAGCESQLEVFRDPSRDLYCEYASERYGRTITKADVSERFVSKTSILGLGFGMGAPKYQATLNSGPTPILMPIESCQVEVGAYRRKFHEIPALWREMDRMIKFMAGVYEAKYALKPPEELIFKCIRFRERHLLLPNGMAILYPGLHFDEGGRARYRDNRGEWIDLWGGKLVENIVQALARIVVAAQMLKIAKRYRIATMTHDEVVALAPAAEADEALNFMVETMREPEPWCPDLPLNAEGGYDYCYSK